MGDYRGFSLENSRFKFFRQVIESPAITFISFNSLEILLPLVYTSLFILLIYRMGFFDVPGISKKWLSALFILKIFSGVLLWLVYSRHYTDRETSDIFKYFDDAGIMFSALQNNTGHYFQMLTGINANAEYLQPYYLEMNNWFKPFDTGLLNDNRTVIRFNAFVYLFSWGNYHVHTVFICFLSFTGLTAIYKLFCPFLTDKTRALAVVVFLLPSVLFWGSGVLKEGILLFGFGMLFYYLYRFLFFKRATGYILWIALSAFILFLTKVYVILAFIPSVVALLVIKITGNRRALLKFLGIHALFLFAAVNMYRISPELDILLTLHQKQQAFINVAIDTGAGSFIQTKKMEPNVYSVLKNSPEALVNTLLRPHIFESKTVFMLMASMENLLLIVLAILSILFFKKPQSEQLPLLYTCIFFVFILALLIGLVTPILGAIVRYKVPLLPLLGIIFILLIDKKSIIQKLSFLKIRNKNEPTPPSHNG